jgi:hypothetical protein
MPRHYEIYLVSSALMIIPNLYRRYILKINNIGFTEKFLLWAYLYYTIIIMDIAFDRNSSMSMPSLQMAITIIFVVVV